MGGIVGMPRAQPQSQPILAVPGDHVQVQVRDRLADHVVDQDHRAVRAEAVFDRALEALRRDEELRPPVGGQVAQQADVPLGREQRVSVEQRPVVEKGDQPLRLEHSHRLLLAADDGAGGTRCWDQARAYRGLPGPGSTPRQCYCAVRRRERCYCGSSSSNHTQVPACSSRKPQRCAISLTRWNPRPFSSCPSASRQYGSPICPSSMTSTCTTAPRRVTATVTPAASVACWTAFVTSSQASSSASREYG